MSDTEKTKAAVDTIARHFIRNAVVYAINGGRIGWEDYPELSEKDYRSVVERAEALVTKLQHSKSMYDGAYAYLASLTYSAE